MDKNRMNKIIKAVILLMAFASPATSQIGEHRNDLSIGVNGGYVMSTVGFTPSIPQKSLGGITGGFTVRYTSEKYFKSICAIVGEVNFAQLGWKEDILTAAEQPVINARTGVAEQYQRSITYVQVPLMARMGWGRERKGMQFFFQLGPQIGIYLSDKTTSNFDYESRNVGDRIGTLQEAVQDTLPVQNKFDYGIAAGLGMEYSHPRLGHFILEGRYYYGLGDIFKNSKSDYFGRSNNMGIYIKLTYLWDITRSRDKRIK